MRTPHFHRNCRLAPHTDCQLICRDCQYSARTKAERARIAERVALQQGHAGLAYLYAAAAQAYERKRYHVGNRLMWEAYSIQDGIRAATIAAIPYAS